jgi:hypothetical protein
MIEALARNRIAPHCVSFSHQPVAEGEAFLATTSPSATG